MSVNYRDYLQSEHWKRLSEKTKRLAGYRCQVCYSPNDLDAHHRVYDRLGRERQTDLICLCHDCHTKYHYGVLEYDDEPIPPVTIFHGKSDSAWGTS